MLVTHEVQRLADIRSYPHSRRHPHFNREILRSGLLELGIDYRHFPELGGLRSSGLDPSPNTAWPEGGFRNYADHMLSTEFRSGVQGLVDEAGQLTVLMCAEADPRQCHRRLLSDYLVLIERAAVAHIVAPEKAKAHEVHPRARVRGGDLIYPPLQGSLF